MQWPMTRSVLKMKGNTVRRNAKRLVQSVIKVPSELIKLQQDVELAIDIFFINKHACQVRLYLREIP
jgi:hypothetical protein